MCSFFALLFSMLFQKQETHRTMAHSFAPIKSKQQKYTYNKHACTHTHVSVCAHTYVYVYVYISFSVCMRALVGAALRGRPT